MNHEEFWENQLEVSLTAVSMARRQLASLAFRGQLQFPMPDDKQAEVIELFPREVA